MMKSGIISFLCKTTTVSLFVFSLTMQPARVHADWILPGLAAVGTTVAMLLPSSDSDASAQPSPVPYPPPVKPVNAFRRTIKDIASQLFENLEDQDPQIGMLAEGVAFTVFVDLKKLTRTSSFGRYLAEQLMTEFQQHGYSVIEVRKSNEILVQAKRGEYGLSRDLNEIGSAVQARALLTGTYTLAGDHVMVNAKILDNKNALMLSSANAVFSKNSLVESLLADSASAQPKTKENVYMKKLEI